MSTPPPALFYEQIARCFADRRPCVVATIVRDSGSVPRRTGAKMLIHEDGAIVGTVGGGFFEQLVIRDGLAAMKNGGSETRAYSFNPKGAGPDAFGAVCGGRVEIFLEVMMPEDRLLIVGGGHCGRALAQAASLLDFSIVLADDREEFSRPSDYAFPHVSSVLHLPADFRGLPEADERTYVALVSKGYPTDEAALRRVINSPAAYIGMIGSIKKRETVFNKLRADGISEELLGRVHSPIGLEIAADTPAEIAVSILAEIIQIRAARRAARRKRRQLQTRKTARPPRHPPWFTMSHHEADHSTPLPPGSDKIAAIVLAAGLSSRMGAFKPLLPLGEKVLIRHILDALRDVPEIDGTMVVTGHEAAQLEAALADSRLTFAYNADYALGEMLSSIQTGLRHVLSETKAIVLALGDQPSVSPNTIRLLTQAWRDSGAPLVWPVYQKRRGHPLLFSMALREEILALPKGQTLKAVVERHRARGLEVEVDDSGVIADLDTPEDYELAKRRWGESHGARAV